MKRLLFLFCALAVLAIALFSTDWYLDNRVPAFTSERMLYVRSTDDVKSVSTKVRDCVKNPERLADVMEEMQVGQYMKPGYYNIRPDYTYVYFARMLNNGWQSPIRFTLSGNLRVKSNIAAKIASQMMVDSATVVKALNDGELLARYGFTPENVFNLLIPDTYEMYWNASVEDILKTQKKAYDTFWCKNNRKRAESIGLSVEQVGILASIVEQETKNAVEMPRIAGVYINRLFTHMPLQADPTIAFCYGYRLNRILKIHLQCKSPYNTYKNAGLPPGPICVPTKEALNAVLNPDFGTPDGKPGNKGYFYFCASPDFSGTHLFARTLAEHNRNATAFRQSLDRQSARKREAISKSNQ